MYSYFRHFIRQDKFFCPLLYTLKFFVDLLIYNFRYLSSSDTSTVDSQLQIIPSICDSSSFLSDGLKLQILYPSNDDSRDGNIPLMNTKTNMIGMFRSSLRFDEILDSENPSWDRGNPRQLIWSAFSLKVLSFLLAKLWKQLFWWWWLWVTPRR